MSLDMWEREQRQREALLLREHCGRFSHMGWALFWAAAAMFGTQFAVVGLVRLLARQLLGNAIFLWVISVGSVYGLGFPLFWLIIRRLPAPPKPDPALLRRPFGLGRFLQLYLMALAGLYLSNLASLGVLWIIGLLRGNAVTNPVESVSEYPVALNLLLGCVIAPLAEETMFRKLLLDRLRPYGDKFAIFTSALCFGIFHGNLNQFFYAFVIGLVFGYVAARTGQIWQTVLLHAMINVISTGLIPLAERAGEVGILSLGGFILVAIPLGIVFFFLCRRTLRFLPGNSGFSTKQKFGLFFGAPGVIFFLIAEGLSAASYFIL